MAKCYILDNIQQSHLVVAGPESVISVERIPLSLNTPGVVTVNLHHHERPITLVQARVGLFNRDRLSLVYTHFENALIQSANSDAVFNTRAVRESVRDQNYFGDSIKGVIVEEISEQPFDFSMLRSANNELMMELIFDPLAPAEKFVAVGQIKSTIDYEETYTEILERPFFEHEIGAVYSSFYKFLASLPIKGVEWYEDDEWEWIKLEEMQ